MTFEAFVEHFYSCIFPTREIITGCSHSVLIKFGFLRQKSQFIDLKSTCHDINKK